MQSNQLGEFGWHGPDAVQPHQFHQKQPLTRASFGLPGFQGHLGVVQLAEGQQLLEQGRVFSRAEGSLLQLVDQPMDLLVCTLRLVRRLASGVPASSASRSDQHQSGAGRTEQTGLNASHDAETPAV